jgi:hypothetical protein
MPKYTIKENSESRVGVNYISKDFNVLKQDLINFAKSYFPDTYNDFNETSAGMMLMEMSAYVGDMLSFYIDEQFKEALLPTVEERRNIMNIARSLGYKVKPVVPAIVRLKFRQTVSDDGTTDENRVPDYNQLMSFDRGLRVQSSTNNNVFFETMGILDFSVTGSGELPPQPIGQDSNGITNLWEINRSILAVSGQTKETSFNIGSPQQFTRLSFTEKNIINIESVIDSNGNTWYEVDHLSQDRVNLKTLRDDPYASSTIPVHYTLDAPISVDKRFIVETNIDNTTSIIFGNGLIKGKNDTSYIQNIYEEHKDMNALVQGTLPSEIDPKSTLFNNSLGESPSNITLTVKYRIGGGLGSNVVSNDLETIVNVDSKQIGGGNRLSTLSSTNLNPARGGEDQESIDVIREKTKSSYASQNRAVTREDYEARILSMPSEFGSVSKVFVNRKSAGEMSDIFSNLDFNSDGSITNIDVDAFQNIIDSAPDGLSDNEIPILQSVKNFISGLTTLTASDLLSFKNLNVYLLSYDHNKNLVKTSDIIKNNLKEYLKNFKILSDDVEIKDGVVINFGVFFRIESRHDVNKADLKLKCIDEIIRYFDMDDMRFNQVIYTKDLANVLYNIEGVKIIHDLKLTQNGDTLNLTDNLYARTGDGTGVVLDGQPYNGVSGPTNDTYGFGYLTEFNNFYDGTYAESGDGVILPPNANETPGVFELKNPYDNVRGIIE